MRLLIFTLNLLPFCWLTWGLYYDQLGGNPIEFFTHQTGQLTLFYLGLTLLITPAQALFGFIQPAQYKRQLGLFTFFYSVLHTLAYIGLDLAFYWDEILIDVLNHVYIMVGLAAVALMIPLALTSTLGWRKRLKKHWKKLHRWVYMVALLGVAHFILLIKADLTEPLLYALVFSTLIGWRFLPETSRKKLKII